MFLVLLPGFLVVPPPLPAPVANFTSEVIVTSGSYPNEVSWSLACDGLRSPITGGAPYSATHTVPLGTCVLTMYDEYVRALSP